tara:strand:+ start:287 stop:496 length:210 start_codon:yes stop_codon:yes gene_type:complete
MERPDFLDIYHANGKSIVDAFSALPDNEMRAVDKWLLINFVYGSLTWKECILFDWLNDKDEDGLRWTTS